MRKRGLTVVAVLSAVTGCGGGGGGDSPAPPPAFDGVALARVFPNLGFSRPVAFLQASGADPRWFVVEQGGVIRVFADSQAASSASTFVDISARVGDSSGEKGLFGIAFDPDFATNGYAYISYTRSGPPLVSHVSRFTSSDGGQTLDAASETVILTLDQPFANHNGGHITFGPDGFLYVGFGDGGSANDPGDRAQDTTNLFGTIVRIDVTPLPYTIPNDNPFAGNPRCPAGTGLSACPEIFALGLRNPWRFSFDRNSGDLWAGDVGQNAWEEVDQVVNGSNYGWRIREGAHCNTSVPDPCITAGLTDPVAEYDHSLGASITGGYVYRGTAIAGLAGSYVFGDFISGRIFRLAPGSSALEAVLESRLSISSFGEGRDGELYVVDYGGGTLQKIVASP